ncbi:MAG: ergothioneine biosynthesis protein EgtB [Rhodospirillaceae bacterium]
MSLNSIDDVDIPDSDVATPDSRDTLSHWFAQTRSQTEALAEPLSPEDQTIQSMEDASPAKWHRAHTSWFFETFVLSPHEIGYEPFKASFNYLFNSYYEAVGARHPRPHRGLLTRPSAAEVGDYRGHVDAAVSKLIADCCDETWSAVAPLIILGLNHEQQHQELLLMDILHAFSCNPLEPAYTGTTPLLSASTSNIEWIDFDGGIHQVGIDQNAEQRFFFDNEGPRHDVALRPFRLANRLVTNAEWIAFIEDGGYKQTDLWLADAWTMIQSKGWSAPLYWRKEDDQSWSAFGLRGRQPVSPNAPVCHVSFYEADAFAAWSGKRLPTESEWEIAARAQDIDGNFLSRHALRPLPAPAGSTLSQMYGDVWEHTSSPYTPYPGFKAAKGAVGEYNGKFMSNQMVLRGGSCVTPEGHIRSTYRNFFYPHQRWMFAGVRLAEDA